MFLEQFGAIQPVSTCFNLRGRANKTHKYVVFDMKSHYWIGVVIKMFFNMQKQPTSILGNSCRFARRNHFLKKTIEFPLKTSQSARKTSNGFIIIIYFWLDVSFFVRCYILHTCTVHKTASLADEGNSAYCQSSSGAHKVKHIYVNLWKLALRGHLNTDAQTRDRTRNFLLTRMTP